MSDQLSRQEISQSLTFDKEMTELMLEMQEAGWTARITKRGHAIMKAPDGVTTAALSRDSLRGRAGRNARAEFERWKRQSVDEMIVPEGVTIEKAGILTRGVFTETQSFECPELHCDRVFPTSGRLAQHSRTHRDMPGLSCLECGREYRNPGSLRRHRRIHRMDRQETITRLALEVMDAHKRLEDATLAYNLEVERLIEDFNEKHEEK